MRSVQFTVLERLDHLKFTVLENGRVVEAGVTAKKARKALKHGSRRVLFIHPVREEEVNEH